MPKSTSKKKSPHKNDKDSHPKPYSNLTLYQKMMREEIQKLHHATETFVRVAVNKSSKSRTLHNVEEHIIEIGKNIDELEDLLHELSKRK
jgi:4-hydroxy-3-methylbut-2-en-1-yl diphosphate synthase IspG/GcpE